MEAMLKHAQDVLRMEAEAILELVSRVDENFAAAVKLILDCQGRTVITGMGKSGLIGRKMAATLASTGTPSFYLHPAEGIHGDLGMVTESDVVIALSNSGETGEVLNILPSLRRIGAKIIAMVGKPDSTLGKNADVVLDVGVSKELVRLVLHRRAARLQRWPTAMRWPWRCLKSITYGKPVCYLPSGRSLGRKLLLTVGSIMHKGEDNPTVLADTKVQDALFVITDKGLGAVSVVDADGVMQGVLTDGDIRRGLSKGVDFLQRPVCELMTKSPKTITEDKLAAQALHLMESNKPKPITVLPVIDKDNKVIGLLHMTDLVRQGVV